MIALLLACWLQTSGTLIDRIVAVIDKEVITESELVTETRVELAWREGEVAAAADFDAGLLAGMRDYLVNQTLIAGQARRLGTVEVPDEVVDRRMWQFGQRFSTANRYRSFLRRFGIAESTVTEILRRDLKNDLYMQQRLRTRLLGSQPGATSDKEAGGQERYAKALKQWLEELRQGVEIRVVGDSGELELQGRR